ncbi:MAG: hypothetical protein SYR96_22510 [Actinomycetota bacterium]|nr:hypothetical protein [Actinomycetota bacterium]
MATTDEWLRCHDPARHVPDGLVRSVRATVGLARITATEPGSGTPAEPARNPVHGRRAVRFALAGVVAVAGVSAAPILGTDDAATATWDAVARPATPQQVAENGRRCAEFTGIGANATPRMVELRGTWVMTYVTTPTGEAQCLNSTVRTAVHPDGEGEAMSGPLLPVPAADALATIGVHMTSAGVSTGTQFMVSGKAGSRVVAVTFETQDMQVKATVKDGYFTAWWPRRTPDTIAGRLIDYSGYNGSPNPKVTITLTGGKRIETRIKDYDVNR